MGIYDEMRAYGAARALLLRRQVVCKDMEMVLFAMIDGDLDYPAALKQYAEHKGIPAREIEKGFADALRYAGVYTDARGLLDELYLEAVSPGEN